MQLFGNLYSIALAIIVGFATTVPSNARSLQERDSDCANGPGWALPVLSIGGGGGTANCETSYGNDYSPVSGIEVWRKGDGDKSGDRIAGTGVPLPLSASISTRLTRHRYTVHIVSQHAYLATSRCLKLVS